MKWIKKNNQKDHNSHRIESIILMSPPKISKVNTIICTQEHVKMVPLPS